MLAELTACQETLTLKQVVINELQNQNDQLSNSQNQRDVRQLEKRKSDLENLLVSAIDAMNKIFEGTTIGVLTTEATLIQRINGLIGDRTLFKRRLNEIATLKNQAD